MNTNLSTRRALLQKGLALLAAAPTIPAFLEQTVWALSNPLDAPRTQVPSGKDGKILVVVQLAGGNDGLNTLIPYGDDQYRRVRPTLGLDAKDVLKVDDYVALHPKLAPLKALYDNGRLAIVQGVGYPNPNRSHFRSMDIWQSAQPENQVLTSGWLGRYFDNTCNGLDPHAGISLGQRLPLAMEGEKMRGLALERPENYRYLGRDANRYAVLNRVKPGENGGSKIENGAAQTASSILNPQPSTLDFLHRTALDAQLSSDQILRVTRGTRPVGAFAGGELGNALRTVAAMIGGGLSTRIYYVSLGGFDTHANQRGRHDQLMEQMALAMESFWKELERQHNDQRVLMMTFSEFGRRVAQNASAGTDHGAAAPMFLIGPGVKAGLAGKHPSLTDLDRGDLRFSADFRSVYAAILEQWLETPSKPILGQQFAPLDLLKRA